MKNTVVKIITYKFEYNGSIYYEDVKIFSDKSIDIVTDASLLNYRGKNDPAVLKLIKLINQMNKYNCLPLPENDQQTIVNLIDKSEYILCAAVHFKNGKIYHSQPRNIDSGIVITGRRHHNCFTPLVYIFGENRWQSGKFKEVQGFLTNKDRFVDRDEGLRIALRANQVMDLDNIRGRLFSEDLY